MMLLKAMPTGPSSVDELVFTIGLWLVLTALAAVACALAAGARAVGRWCNPEAPPRDDPALPVVREHPESADLTLEEHVAQEKRQLDDYLRRLRNAQAAERSAAE